MASTHAARKRCMVSGLSLAKADRTTQTPPVIILRLSVVAIVLPAALSIRPMFGSQVSAASICPAR
jgi:hypothetical protein